jgi:hypothetical protein
MAASENSESSYSCSHSSFSYGSRFLEVNMNCTTLPSTPSASMPAKYA